MSVAWPSRWQDVARNSRVEPSVSGNAAPNPIRILAPKTVAVRVGQTDPQSHDRPPGLTFPAADRKNLHEARADDDGRADELRPFPAPLVACPAGRKEADQVSQRDCRREEALFVRVGVVHVAEKVVDTKGSVENTPVVATRVYSVSPCVRLSKTVCPDTHQTNEPRSSTTRCGARRRRPGSRHHSLCVLFCGTARTSAFASTAFGAIVGESRQKQGSGR